MDSSSFLELPLLMLGGMFEKVEFIDLHSLDFFFSKQRLFG